MKSAREVVQEFSRRTGIIDPVVDTFLQLQQDHPYTTNSWMTNLDTTTTTTSSSKTTFDFGKTRDIIKEIKDAEHELFKKYLYGDWKFADPAQEELFKEGHRKFRYGGTRDGKTRKNYDWGFDTVFRDEAKPKEDYYDAEWRVLDNPELPDKQKALPPHED